jgi:CelD/BcsL family acetyltransferase involved in cellulose biosynthesis
MNRPVIQILRSVAELESLATEWARLAERFRSPLLDHEWFTSAAGALHREDDLRIVTLRHRGVLTAVAPTAVDGSGRLVVLGSAALHEPAGWLYSSESTLRQLTRAIVKMGHVIVMDRVPMDPPVSGVLPRWTRWRAVTIKRQTTESLIVPTNVPWPSYCATLSRQMRRKLVNVRTKAEQAYGPVRFVRSSPLPNEVPEALARLVQVEATGWKARRGTALATRPDLLHFFELYAGRAAARGRLRVSVLWFGDTPAAVELGIEAYGRMWGLKLAYDERLASFAPALQLVHASIGTCAANGLEAYEFLGSAESWQERWRPERRRYELTAIYPIQPRAILTAVRDVTSHVSRRLQRTFRVQGTPA